MVQRVQQCGLLEAEKLKGHLENLQCAEVKGAISVNPRKLVCYDTFSSHYFIIFSSERQNGHNQYTIMYIQYTDIFFVQKVGYHGVNKQEIHVT
jgi:hypothetical protein